jgi:nucleotide-binding universal stress UspA family protein
MNQTNQDPGGIVCATRGGEGSEPTIQHAIGLAREREVRLTFLYIADLEFMKRAPMAHTSRAAEELRKLGEFIMMTLVEQAQAEGIEADFAVRQGRFRDELLCYLEETHPAMLVLGCPQPDTCYFDPRGLSQLAQEVQESTGVQVEFA